jgi:hypothetical protein
VVAVLTRLPVKSATIVPDGDTLGCVYHYEPSKVIQEDMGERVWNSSTKRCLFRTMIVCHAGFLAEMRVASNSQARVYKSGSQDDFKKLFEYAESCWGPEYQNKIDQSGNEAEKLQDAHWSVVEAVAEALLEKRTLSGKAVRKITMENGGRQYLVRGGLESCECFKRNGAGELVKFHPQIDDLDHEAIWNEVPMTVEPRD